MSGLWTAAARARESSRTDALFEDDLAGDLAGEQGWLQLAAREADGIENPYLPVRTRFFDDVIRASVGPAHQVVLLGAGMDTRAFRLTLPPRTTIFEIDRAEVFDYKEHALAGTVAPGERRVVPADLRGEWFTELTRAGFRSTAPTLWIAEGLLFHLPTPAVRTLLRQAAEGSAPGSDFVADVFGKGLLHLPSMRPLIDARRAAGAEPPFCTDQPRELFADCGWPEVQVIPAFHIGARLGRHTPSAEPLTPRPSTLTSSFITARSQKDE
ncbi:SAM-dependent methyltransferase [Herbiconiux sp. 11R-BC]|uniref:SAM-dependent methyltransferase n=1 Tax=Herbiconiux sp. 11R-BC TaxID=3111637 RepID=UPI003C0E3DC7